ncbi:hypothetical protein CTI12_AA534630 [Artemisia annua]|uniref:Uncharacterized protein n=1 Tax=Artemisia annua TaxID=35608 RepID=A0A2U1L2I3_ARTAN|nr:hypothetical protein CTI12_AA534630 [Artemisia annua]
MYSIILTPPPQAHPLLTHYESNDSLVVMWIYSTISPKLVDMIVDDSATASGVWKRRTDIFHDNKDARVIQLDNEIRNMVIGNLSVTDFFQDLKSKADRLANLGSKVNDSSLVTYAINGERVTTALDEAVNVRHKSRISYWSSFSSYRRDTARDGNVHESIAYLRTSFSKSPTLSLHTRLGVDDPIIEPSSQRAYLRTIIPSSRKSFGNYPPLIVIRGSLDWALTDFICRYDNSLQKVELNNSAMGEVVRLRTNLEQADGLASQLWKELGEERNHWKVEKFSLTAKLEEVMQKKETAMNEKTTILIGM